MSSFEKEFPSLKFSVRQGEFDITSKGYSCWAMERFLEDIQKHCLDKQRVREAIKRLPNDNRRYILLKELGLEDEK